MCVDLPRYRDGGHPTADLLAAVAPTRIPPGSLRLDPGGFHGLVLRKLRGRYRRAWTDQVQLVYEQTNMSDAQLRRRYAAIAEAFGDWEAGGRWWERSWLDSRLPEEGGAPALPWVARYGEEVELLRLGALSLTNEMKLHVDRVAILGVDPDPARILRELTGQPVPGSERPLLAGRGEGRVGRPAVMSPRLALALGLPEPDLRVFDGADWSLGIRPRLHVRPDTEPRLERWVRDLSLRCDLDLRLGQRKEKVLALECELSYSPEDEELSCGWELVLVSW